MNIEIVRAIILFAIGDPGFREQLVQDPDQAIAGYGLGADEQILLGTVRFDGPIQFTDEQLLEQLLGSAKTGWEAFGGFGAASGLALPDLAPDMADLLSAGGIDFFGDPDFGLPRVDDPNAGAGLLNFGFDLFADESLNQDPPAEPPSEP